MRRILTVLLIATLLLGLRMACSDEPLPELEALLETLLEVLAPVGAELQPSRHGFARGGKEV